MTDRRRTTVRPIVPAVLAGLVVIVSPLASVRATPLATTERVSVGASGQQGNQMSGRFSGPAIDADGSVVAFDSDATTLVPQDTNGQTDVFVHDRTTNSTERVSVSSSGVQANGLSTRPAVNASGGLVAFDSSATNLVPGDTNRQLDVFVHNRANHRTFRVSVGSDGLQGTGSSNSPSIGGRFVSFISSSPNLVPGDTNGVEDVFVRDLVAGTTERVSVSSTGEQGNSSSTAASISANGRYVAFSSFASNLVTGDTNDAFDVFLHDRVTGATERMSVSSDEVQGDAMSVSPSVSRNGRFVAFYSDATNLVPGDTNGRTDIFVRDRMAALTERDSVSSDEQQADGSSPEPGVRGFVASGPDITPDGRYVAFFSSATNLVPDDTNTCPLFFSQTGTCPDAFARDRVAGTTTRVSLFADGSQSDERNSDPAISDDGAVVAFWSAAALVPEDTNVCPLFSSFPGNCPDIFVRDLTT
jgi:Tol biopolymer transport system component